MESNNSKVIISINNFFDGLSKYNDNDRLFRIFITRIFDSNFYIARSVPIPYGVANPPVLIDRKRVIEEMTSDPFIIESITDGMIDDGIFTEKDINSIFYSIPHSCEVVSIDDKYYTIRLYDGEFIKINMRERFI